jgi:CysZ protein
MFELATGVRDVGRGLAMLKAHPRLWKWLIAPAVVTLLVLGAAIALLVHLVAPVSDWITEHLPGPLATTSSVLLTVVLVVGLGAAALVVFAPVAGTLAGPFCEQLSEHVEAELTVARPPPFALSAFVHGAVLGVVHSVRRLVAALLGFVLVFAIGLVPVIGTVAAVVLGGWFAGRATAYDCYDAVLARRNLPYRDKLAYLARCRGRSLGLGLAVAAMLIIPGLNLIALGIGAAGATVADHAMAGARRRSPDSASRSDRIV